jgi:hypothetical protein
LWVVVGALAPGFRLFEVEPASGQVSEHLLPAGYRTPASYPLFDVEGNLVLVWVQPSGVPNVEQVRVHSRAPSGGVRYDVTFDGFRHSTTSHRMRALMAPDGTLLTPATGGAGLFLLRVMSDGTTGQLFLGPNVSRLPVMDAAGRIFFAANPGLVMVAPDGSELLPADAAGFGFVPSQALASGELVGGLLFGSRFAPLVAAADGLPLAIGPDPLVQEMPNLVPSRGGYFTFTTTFEGLTDATLRVYAPGEELLLQDEAPLDIVLEACAGAAQCAANRLLLSAGLDVADFEECGAEPLDSIRLLWQDSGPGSIQSDNSACDEDLPEDCATFFVPDGGPGLSLVTPTVSLFFPCRYREEVRHRWRSIRRVEIAGDGAGLLRLAPVFQTLTTNQIGIVEATRDGAPVTVGWEVLSGAERLGVPVPASGSAISIIPRDEATRGAVTLRATDPANGEQRTAALLIERAPRLTAVDPDPNPAISTVRKGGTAFRYYRLVAGPEGAADADLEHPQLEAVFRVLETGETFSAFGLTRAPTDYLGMLVDVGRQVKGLLVVGVPWSALEPGVIGETTRFTVRLEHFLRPGSPEQLLPEAPHSFTLDVVGRPFTKELAVETELEAEIPFVTALLSGRGVTGFEDLDFELAGRDTQILEHAQAGGLETGFNLFDFRAEFLGYGVQVEADVKASAQGGEGARYLFTPVSAAPAVQDVVLMKLAQVAIRNQLSLPLAVAGPLRGLLRAIEDNVPDLPDAELAPYRERSFTTVSASVKPLEVAVKIGLVGEPDDRVGLLEEAFIELKPVDIEYTGDLTLSELGAMAGGGSAAGVEVRGDFAVPRSDDLFLSLCRYDPSCPVNKVSEEVETGPTGSLRRLQLGLEQQSGERRTWTIEGEPLRQVFEGGFCERSRLLADFAGCTDCPACGESGVIATLKLLPQLGQIELERALLAIGAGHAVQFEVVQPQETELESAGIGGKLFGLGAKIEGQYRLSQTSRRDAGVVMRGARNGLPPTEWLLERYLDVPPYVPPLGGADEPELKLNDLMAAALADLLGVSILLEQHQVAAAVEQVIQHPEAGGAAGAAKRASTAAASPLTLTATWSIDTTVEVSSWPPEPLPDPVTRSDVAGPSPSPAMVQVGYFHDFHHTPDPPVAIVGGTIVLGYPEADLGDAGLGGATLDESLLQIGRWDPDAESWMLLPSTPDPAGNSVTAAIDQEGIYAVLFTTSLACPVLDPLAVGAGSVTVSWSAMAAPEVNGYSVYRASQGNDTFRRIAAVPAGQTTYTDDDLAGVERMTLYAVAPRLGNGTEGCLSAPLSTDADGDGVSDLYEIAHGLVVGADNGALDGDADGLSDLEESLQRTDPAVADTDADGLDDGDEVDLLGTDPLSPDSDGDGLSDGDEVDLHGSDPLRADTDRDGLDDGEEVEVFGSDPLSPDTDADGLPDGDEVDRWGTDPLLPDTDADDLLDLEELLLGTDPSNPDSDGDGFTDGAEIEAGTDPLDPASHPDAPDPSPTPLDFYTLTPCRLLDTRQPGQGPALSSGADRLLVVPPTCGVPATARALAVNLTVVGATGAGFVTAYPAGVPLPPTSTLNFATGATRANNALLPLPLDGSGGLLFRPIVTGGGTVHLLVDTVGYFE